MNEACKDLLQADQISAVDVVVTGPWFEHFANWSKANPQYDVGISIALTNPYSSPSWRLMSSEYGPTTLVDAHGEPWKSVVQLVSHATANDVKSELDAQIMKARQAGMTPTHLTGFYGTVYSRVDLAAVFLGAAKKYWIPATVVELTPELTQHFREQGYPIDNEMLELITNYPLPKVDDMQLTPVADCTKKNWLRTPDCCSRFNRGSPPSCCDLRSNHEACRRSARIGNNASGMHS